MKKRIKNLLAAILVGFTMTVAFVGCESPSLQDLADELSKEFPIDNGNGFVIKSCELNNDYFILRSECDESLAPFPISELEDGRIGKERSKQMEDMMLKDEHMKHIYKVCKEEKKGLRMTMTGNRSGKMVTAFDITPEKFQTLDF